jgi:hypothetical protein
MAVSGIWLMNSLFYGAIKHQPECRHHDHKYKGGEGNIRVNRVIKLNEKVSWTSFKNGSKTHSDPLLHYKNPLNILI